MRWRKRAMLLAVILAGAIASRAQTKSSKHTITVTFTYDFRGTKACSEKVKKNCVMQFIVYDLSAGYKHRTKLFAIPVEEVHAHERDHDHDHEAGVKEITMTGPSILFESGKHLLGVSAQTPEGVESDPRACKTWVEIP